jgi:hypothetical protein
VERRLASVRASQAEVLAFLSEMKAANRLPNAMVALLEVGILYPILLEAIAYGRKPAEKPARIAEASSRFETLSLAFAQNGEGAEPDEKPIDHMERFRKLAVREEKDIEKLPKLSALQEEAE